VPPSASAGREGLGWLNQIEATHPSNRMNPLTHCAFGGTKARRWAWLARRRGSWHGASIRQAVECLKAPR
jgi:hypothetical protein